MSVPIILSTGSLYNFDVSTAMALAGEAGFAGIELMVDWRWETHDPAHLEKLMTRHNLSIMAVHSPFSRNFILDWPGEPVAVIEQSVKLAERLGAQTVVVHPPQRWVRLQGLIAGPQRTRKLSVPLPVAGIGPLGRWLLEDLADFQAKTTVKLAIENMPCRRLGPLKLEPHHFFRSEELNQFQHLTLDTTHVGTRYTDLLDFYSRIKEKVAHIHLSNHNGREHQLLDNGHLPLARLLTELAKDNFAGLISIELSPFSLQVHDERTLRQNLRDSLVFCQQALADRPQG